MKLSYESDAGFSAGGSAIGVVVLSTDETLETELRQVAAQSDTSVYHTRIPFEQEVTPETLGRMEDNIPASVSLFPPNIEFGAIGFGCTSGATVIGADNVAAKVHTHFKGVPVSDPITAVIAACNALGVKKLGMLTPYRRDVSAAMSALLEKNGIEISAFASFEEDQDNKVARISETSTLEGMMHVGAGDCDAVFASCTNLRAFNVIEKAEKALGKPVFSSNSAFAWHLHRLAGVTGPMAGPGHLYTL
jgi:maleate isomerase